MEKIIEIKNINKKFTDIQALKDVSFNVYSNEVNTIIGKNGAGKTTLLKIILSLLKQDSGNVTFKEGISFKQVSYLSEERGLYTNKTGYENLEYFCYISDITSKKEIKERISEISKLFNIENIMKKKIKELSKGNAQKIQLATAFVTNSKIIILDEPFSGLDIIKQQELSKLIKQMSEKTTILVCTHSIDFIEHFSQNVLLLKEGQTTYSGEISKLIPEEKFIFVNDKKVENQNINDLIKNNVEFEYRKEHLKEQIIKLIGGDDEK